MKLALAIFAIAFAGASGCATGAAARGGDTIRPRGLEMLGHLEVQRIGRFAHLAADAGGRAEAGIRVCVAPDGRARSADVTRSSGSERFDAAASKALAAGRYRAFSAPPETRVCRVVRLVFDAG